MLSVRRRGRGSLVQVTAAGVAAALLCVMLLLLLNYPSARVGALSRDAARQFVTVPERTEQNLHIISNGIGGMSVVLLYGIGSPELLPPGLDRFPQPGESFVSPAVLAQCRAADRCAVAGRIAGVIHWNGLTSPGELFVYTAPESASPPAGAEAVVGLGTEVVEPPAASTASLGFVAFAIAPAAALMAVALRLGARRSARRIVALRTLGMSRLSAAIDLAAPAIAGTAIGALLGVAAYRLLLVFARSVPVVGNSYEQRDLIASPAQGIAVAGLVLVGVSAATVFGSLRFLVSAVPAGASRARWSARVRSTILTTALLSGLVIILVRSLTLYGDFQAAPGGPMTLTGVVLLAVGLMGGAAPLAALIARLVPVGVSKASIGLGFRRAQVSAAAVTRASGPVALATFLACVSISLNGLYGPEITAVFRDDATELTTFATRDGRATVLRPTELDGLATNVIEEWPVANGSSGFGRALRASCADAAVLLGGPIANCNGQAQLLQINSDYSATAADLPPALGLTIETANGPTLLEVSTQVASVSTDVNLPFADYTFILPPTTVSGRQSLIVERMFGQVETTREAFERLVVQVARADPTTSVELPSTARPEILGVYRWLTLGSLVAGMICLIAMATAFVDLRSQQARGYALLRVLGSPRATSRAAHIVSLAFPAVLNILIATGAGVLAGLGYVRTLDLLPSWTNFALVAVTGSAVGMLTAACTVPRRMSARAVSSLIHAE